MEYYLGNNVIYKKSKIIELVLVIVMLDLTLFPFPDSINAKIGIINEVKAEVVENTAEPLISEEVNALVTKVEIKQEQALEVAWSKRYTMTAYNSDVAQCDASPCITANGFNVCKHGIEDTVAANFLPFGTKLRIPELFGDRIFVVRDRMNSRYTERVDVWFLHRDNAIDFGVKYPLIEVLK